MIAKYGEQFFNISLIRKPIRIWKYDFVEGFDKKVKSEGLVVYEKFLDLSEIQKVFEVGFSACWHGKQCGAVPLGKNEVQLITNDRQFARQYGMEEFEREVFWNSVCIDECSEFKMETEDVLTGKTEVTIISKEEFIDFYQKFVGDLIPPRA